MYNVHCTYIHNIKDEVKMNLKNKLEMILWSLYFSLKNWVLNFHDGTNLSSIFAFIMTRSILAFGLLGNPLVTLIQFLGLLGNPLVTLIQF